MPLKRRKKKAEDEGSPAWMATFSDLATLLLAFFVLLYSFSIIDIQKFETFVASFRGVGVLESGLTPVNRDPKSQQQLDNPSDSTQQQEQENFVEIIKQLELDSEMEQEIIDPSDLDQQLVQVYQMIKTFLIEQELETEISIRYETKGIVLEIKDKVLFDSGKAYIKPEARILLDELAEVFRDIPNQISIEGHTDNVPTKSSNHATNWELSVDRAVKVVRYFTEQKSFLN